MRVIWLKGESEKDIKINGYKRGEKVTKEMNSCIYRQVEILFASSLLLPAFSLT